MIGAPRSRHDLRKVRLVPEPADVIHHRRARLERRFGDRSFVGVNRDWNVDLGREPLDDRQHPLPLLSSIERVGAGTSRLPSDVEQVGAVSDHLHTCFNSVRGIEEHAPVRERVRRDVDNAHHQRARTQFERTSTGQRQGESTTGIHEGNLSGRKFKGQSRRLESKSARDVRTYSQLCL